MRFMVECINENLPIFPKTVTILAEEFTCNEKEECMLTGECKICVGGKKRFESIVSELPEGMFENEVKWSR